MADLTWMPKHVKRWLTSERVNAMTIAQEGAFSRLLVLAWDHPACTVPADRDTLKRLAKWGDLPDSEFDAVFACFEPHPKLPDRLFNRVQMEEWAKAMQLHRDKVKAGKKGGLRRALNAGQAALKRNSTQNNTIQNRTGQKKKEKKKGAAAAMSLQSDEDFIKDLKAARAYRGLDIDQELERAQVWCRANRRTCTQRFFVNWLNRAKPMPEKGTHGRCTNRVQDGQFLRPCPNEAAPGSVMCKGCQDRMAKLQAR